MINLLVSEAEALDFLSILTVKAKKDPTNPKNQTNYSNCHNYLWCQIGTKMLDIGQSKEYKKLCKVNEEIFNLIDKLRKRGETVGDKIDTKNLLRFEHKKALQLKFFGNEINETKLRYD